MRIRAMRIDARDQRRADGSKVEATLVMGLGEDMVAPKGRVRTNAIQNSSILEMCVKK
jgi:hypothetical protein